MLSAIFSAIADSFRSLSEPSNASLEAYHFDALAGVERHEEATSSALDSSSSFFGFSDSSAFDYSTGFDHSGFDSWSSSSSSSFD